MVPQSKTRPALRRQRKGGPGAGFPGTGAQIPANPGRGRAGPGTAGTPGSPRGPGAAAGGADAARAPAAVRKLVVGEEHAGQRLDNYLLRLAKGVPKSHVYRIVRSGEVRVNGGRSTAEYRLAAGDELRIPPLRLAQADARSVAPAQMPAILYEDEHLLVLDKPSGVAAHGGSGVAHGVIERVRAARPNQPFLELGHRLDRETSGVLLLAKTRRCLVALHAQMREGRVEKRYYALVVGDWVNDRQHVRLALAKRTLAGGERRVFVDAGEGMDAHTIIHLRARLDGFSLVEAELKTGRTHQIRVHLTHLGFPLLGDDKYGDFEINRRAAKGEFGPRLGRMFLHAFRVRLEHPVSGVPLTIESPLAPDCAAWLEARDPGGVARARYREDR
jgi:23S rRNA pseudouridine955/2504/2580 synthase